MHHAVLSTMTNGGRSTTSHDHPSVAYWKPPTSPTRTCVWLTAFGLFVLVFALSMDLSGYLFDLTAIGDALKGESSETQQLKVRGKAPIAGTLEIRSSSAKLPLLEIDNVNDTPPRKKIPYYHCPASKTKAETGDPASGGVRNLVLLHGMHYTHQVWKDTGVLSALCQVESLQVTAIDLDVKSTHSDLKRALQEMLRAKLVTELPVDVLVTPSASGKSIVSWLEQSADKNEKKRNAAEELPDFVRVWIPVASPAVRTASEEALTAIRGLAERKAFSVVAIHGDLDAAGKQTSERLEKYANARVVELKGGHSVYRDSPDDFVVEVMLALQSGGGNEKEK